MSFWSTVKKIVHKTVLLRPLLKVIGVKEKTVISKIGEGAEVVDKAINEK